MKIYCLRINCLKPPELKFRLSFRIIFCANATLLHSSVVRVAA
jgi:hypothetical protein